MGYRLTKAIKSHAGRITAIETFGDVIVTASDDTTLKVFSVPGFKLLITYTHHKMGVNDIKAASPIVYSCGQDRRIKSIDLCTNKVVSDYVGHTHSVTTVDTGGVLVSGSVDRSVRTWDIRTGREVSRLNGHTDIVTKVVVDGDKIVSSSMDGFVRIWDKRSSNVMYFSSGVRTLGRSEDKFYVVLRDSVIVLDSQMVQASVYPYRSVKSILCDSVSVFFGHDGFIRVQKQGASEDVKCRGSIECMAVHGQHILCGGGDKTLQVVDII